MQAWRRPQEAAGPEAVETRSSANPMFDAESGAKVRAFNGDPMYEDDEEDAYADKRCGRCRRCCFGSRRRRLIYFTVSTILIALFAFLGVRISQALDLTNTKPSFSKVQLGSMCSNSFSFKVQGTLDNPAVVGATLKATRSAIRIEDGIVGYLNTPDIVVGSGSSPLSLDGSFEICDECLGPLRTAMQRWFDGERIDYKLKLDITAQFDASVFLVPVSFSTSLEFDTFLESYFDATLTREEREQLALEAAMKGEGILSTVALVAAGEEVVEARLGLNMTREEPDEETKRRNEEEGFGNYEMAIEVPSLSFRAKVAGAEVAVGASQPFTFGGKDLLSAGVRLTWAHVAAVNDALVLYQEQSDIPFSVVGDDQAELLPGEGDCFLQELVQGVEIRNTLEFYDSVIAYEAEKAKTKPALAALEGLRLDSLDEEGVLAMATDINVQGTLDFYSFEGKIPPLNVSIAVNSTSPEARESIGSVSLTTGLEISQRGSASISDVGLAIDLDNATLIYAFAEQATGLAGDFTPFVFAAVQPDTLLGALLQTYEVALPFNEAESALAGARRRLAQSSAARGEAQPVGSPDATIFFQVTDEYMQLELGLAGVTKEHTLGYELAFDAFNFTLSAFPFGNADSNTTVDFFNVAMNDFDLRTNDSANITLSLRLFDDLYEGAMVIDLIDRIYALYEAVTLDVFGVYGLVGLARTRNVLRKANWAELGGSTGTPVEGSAVDGVLAIRHFEIDGLYTNVIQLTSAFSFNIANLIADVTLPALALSVADCSVEGQASQHLVSIVSQATAISIGVEGKDVNEVTINLDFADTQSEQLLASAATWVAGNASKVCIEPHPDESKADFLSSLIAAFNIQVQLVGLDEDTKEDADGVAETSQLDLRIVADDRSLCTAVQVNLTEANAAWDTSFGWGALEWSMLEQGTGNQFFTWRAPDAFIGGTCASPWATPESCADNVVSFSFCLETNNIADLDAGATAVRQLAERIVIDQLAVPVQVAGYSTNRRNATEGRIPIAATFTLPKNAIDTLTGVVPDSSSEAFAVSTYIDAVRIVSLLGPVAQLAVEPTTGPGTFAQISLTLPRLRAAIETELRGATSTVAQATVALPERSTSLNASVKVALTSWAALFEAAILVRDEEGAMLRLTRVGDPQSFLDRIIPTVDLAGADAAATAPPAGPVANIELVADSTSSSTTLSLSLEALEEVLPFALAWSADTVALTDGVSALGSLTLPEARFGLKGSRSGAIQIVLSGPAAPLLTRNLFQGSDVSLGLTSSTSSRWDVGFTIPKKLLEALALGTDAASGGASDAITLRQLSILGGNQVGSDVVFPCLISSYCTNLAKDEALQPLTAITLGMAFSLPDLATGSSISFVVDLRSDLVIEVDGNGLQLGELVLLPFKLESAKTGPAQQMEAALRFAWNEGELETVRFVVDRVSTSDSLVLSFRGSAAAQANYVSELLGGIEQDVFLESKASDPTAEPLVGEFDLSVQSTTSKEAVLLASAPLRYLNGVDDLNIFLPLGAVEVEVKHQSLVVAKAAFKANQADGVSFFLEPKAAPQTVAVVATAFRDTAEGPVTKALNSLVTKFVFPDDIQLELAASILPPRKASIFNAACDFDSAEARKANGCGFKLTTQLTMPKVDAQSEFIADFAISMGGSLSGSIFSLDAQVQATKSLYNSLPFDVIISHFRYKVVMYDTDGTIAENDCRGITKACGIWWWQICESPYPEPKKKNIVQYDEYVTVGDPLYPARTLLKEDQKYLPSKGTGDVDIIINPESEDLFRMWHQYDAKQLFCADIADARMVVGIQTPGATCSDGSDTTVDSLRCTFVLDLNFNMFDFALTDNDSCRGPVNAQEDLNNPVTISTGFQWRQVDNFFSAATSGSSQYHWTQSEVSLIDSFEIEIIVQYRDDDRVELIFSPSKSGDQNGEAAVYLKTDGCNEAGVRGAQSKSQSLMHSVTSSTSSRFVITFDAYTRRVRIRTPHANVRKDRYEDDTMNEYADFDFNPQVGSLANAKKSWFAIKHDPSHTTITSRVIRFDKTDSSRTSLVKAARGSGDLNPVVNSAGYLVFQSRDKEGRRRGAGGETWNVRIVNADEPSATVVPNQVTVAIAKQSACAAVDESRITCSTTGAKTCVCDMDDGTYRVVYSFQQRGRYKVSVASPSASISPNTWVDLTERVFVRER